MGIYSYFRLEILDNQAKKILEGNDKQQVIQALFDDTEIDQYDFAENALTLNGETNDESKWYDCQQDLEIFSKEHPHLTFILGQRLCCPESEDEEGEFFMAITDGGTRHIHEPAFMKAKPSFVYFKNEDELSEAVRTYQEQDDITFQIFIGLDQEVQAHGIFERLSATSLNGSVEMTLRGGVGKPFYAISSRLNINRQDEFWVETKRVLIQ